MSASTVGRFVRRSSVALTLSMAALPILVNGQPNTLTTTNKSTKESGLKDSVADTAQDFRKFIDVVFKTGADGRFKQNIARTIGLPGEVATKDTDANTISSKSGATEVRFCSVVYESTPDPASKDNQPICAYIIRYIRASKSTKSQYYRVNLDGHLEKAVLVQSKRDEGGKVIKGSGVPVEQDINSPEVKQAFNTEASYWLKDWLKKQKAAPKPSDKKTAAAM